MKLTGIIETIFEGRYVFRGFATLEELALFSKPNYNYQRVPDEKRIGNLLKFITGNNPYKFFTELLFGYSFNDPKAIANLRELHIAKELRLDGDIKLNEVKLKNAKTQLTSFSNTASIQKIISLDFSESSPKLLRIDGNHRLSAVDKILESQSCQAKDLLKEQIRNTVVPFSILLQGDNDTSENYEAAIFYLINANSVPLTMEQNLSVLLKGNRFSGETLNSVFDIRNASLMLDIVNRLEQESFTECSNTFKGGFYTCVYQLCHAFDAHELSYSVATTISAFYRVKDDILSDDSIKLCSNINIFTAMIYYACKSQNVYSQFKVWLHSTKIIEIVDIQLDTIISLFDKAMNATINVFVAMPFYSQDVIRSTNDIYSRVIWKLRNKYNIDISLPGGIMTYEGSTINIINDVFNRIENCNICFCDITGNNPNVTYEMGWARALKKHVVVLKEESAEGPKSDYGMDFYSTFKKEAYITLEEAIEKNLKAILKKHYSIVIDQI